jgi:biotin/lipoyl-binding protein
VKKDDVLFQIDPAPFQYKVKQLQASLAAAKQQTEILKSNYDQASAKRYSLLMPQMMKPLGDKAERSHLGAVAAFSGCIPGKLRFQNVVDPYFGFVQFGLAPRILDILA